MQIFPSRNQFKSNATAEALLRALEAREEELELTQALIYRSFPLYKDEEGNMIMADCILLSPSHGVVAIAASQATEFTPREERRCQDIVEQVPSFILSRLIKNGALRKTPTQLSFEISPIVFAPSLPEAPQSDLVVLTSDESLQEFFDELREKGETIPDTVFQELVSTIDGAKGLIRPKKRSVDLKEGSKGKQAELTEAAITNFDQRQKHGIMGQITGPQRLRGLAGSGKTVVLAMKAALTHLQQPKASIAYTFSTKALYQHVKRLITRFYRQFDDRDPDWDKHLHVLHAWGGQNVPGIYSEACRHHGVPPIRYQEAATATIGDRFDYVCENLTKNRKIEPMYDFVFVDEGQDFPVSFMRLTRSLAKDGRFVLAYDDLQTIFQATTPSTIDIFGADATGKPNVEFQEDVVLYKCYRNPREILVTAHALGFGIYGPKVVQMLESKEHWEDVGYEVVEGEFKAGERITVERPEANSLGIISEHSGIDEIIKCHVANDVKKEVAFVVESIENDLKDGLEPEDILVVCVDDRNAKDYLNDVESTLSLKKIYCNNVHSDTYGIRDFTKEGRVTLATVHKAKGNESFMVYVIGVDAVMDAPDVRRRNMLFTAMTRAKGWVRVSGVGDGARRCEKEVKQSKELFPRLVFKYPESKDLKRMKRDLAEPADKMLRARRMIERLRQDYSDTAIKELLGEKTSKSFASKTAKVNKFKK